MSPRTLDKLIEVSMGLLPSRLAQEKIHFCYILDKNKKIISIGQNSGKTHPAAADKNYPWPNLHAELDAFIKAPQNIEYSRCTMINVRLSRKSYKVGSPIFRMSRPCAYCIPWIIATKFKQVYYTTNEGFAIL